MANISVSLPSDGDTIDVADYNTPITTIVNEINGGLDNSNIASDAAIEHTKLAAQEAWIEIGSGGAPAFTNSWVNFNVAYASCAFMKDSLGFVHLKGMAKSGTVNSSLFTLPAGYRPALNEYYAVVSNDLFAEMQVASDGTVRMPAGGSNVFTSLNGITFRAA